MTEDGISLEIGGGVVEGAFWGAEGSRLDGTGRERVVVLGKLVVQVSGGGEAVDEGGLASRAWLGGVGDGRVREEVEQLQARRVGKVRRVRVRWERVVGVRRVDRVDFACEVPEAAVVGGADVGDAFDQGLGRRWVGGGRGDEA